MTDEERQALATELEAKLRPLVDVDKTKGGYDCCGCSTYDLVLDDAIAVVRGTYVPDPNRWQLL